MPSPPAVAHVATGDTFIVHQADESSSASSTIGLTPLSTAS